MSTEVKIIGTNEKGEPTKLHVSESAYPNERGQLMLEAAEVAREIRILNMRINGLHFTQKNQREHRLEKLQHERGEKLKRLVELKKQFDALAASEPVK